MVREPAVAGTFYPKDPEQLRRSVSECLGEPGPASPALAVIAPHAGYVYSGRFAGSAYRALEVPDRVVALCPNHTGLGARVSVWARGEWVTPLGRVPVDEALAGAILEEAKGLATEDTVAHLREHAIEVHLPFLLERNPRVRIAPIVVGPLSLDGCRRLGEAIARAVERAGAGRPLLLASTDMSHYIPAAEAQEKDALALDRIARLDPEGLYEVVSENEISMCGFLPTTCVLFASQKLGAQHAKIVAYGHSGEVTKDHDSVVAYASAIVS